MDVRKIDNIELRYLTLEDYEALKNATIQAYDGMVDNYWKLEEIGNLLEIFPEGQVVIVVDGKIAGNRIIHKALRYIVVSCDRRSVINDVYCATFLVNKAISSTAKKLLEA